MPCIHLVSVWHPFQDFNIENIERKKTAGNRSPSLEVLVTHVCCHKGAYAVVTKGHMLLSQRDMCVVTKEHVCCHKGTCVLSQRVRCVVSKEYMLFSQKDMCFCHKETCALPTTGVSDTG